MIEPDKTPEPEEKQEHATKEQEGAAEPATEERNSGTAEDHQTDGNGHGGDESRDEPATQDQPEPEPEPEGPQPFTAEEVKKIRSAIEKGLIGASDLQALSALRSKHDDDLKRLKVSDADAYSKIVATWNGKSKALKEKAQKSGDIEQ